MIQEEGEDAESVEEDVEDSDSNISWESGKRSLIGLSNIHISSS